VRTRLAIPYAYNSFRPNSGVLTPEDFAKGATKILPLDEKRMVAKFSDSIEIPLHPFFGSLGVAPPEAMAGFQARRRGSTPATSITKTSWPEPACSFQCTSRARCSWRATAMPARETAKWISPRSKLPCWDLPVRGAQRHELDWPRGETPTHYIAMGLNPDLTEALRLAVREAIQFLVTEKHLSREDAYMLCSTAVDFNVTQAVDGTKGVHAMIPKSIFH